MMAILKTILGWITGPITKIGEVYVEGRNKAEMKRLENEEKRDFLRNEMQKALLEDGFKADQLVAQIIRNERGDAKTSWIRPVTAVIALVFWVALALSQITLGGAGILPIVWHVPPGMLGQAFLAFPMGVLATFYIVRPFEKHLIRKG